MSKKRKKRPQADPRNKRDYELWCPACLGSAEYAKNPDDFGECGV